MSTRVIVPYTRRLDPRTLVALRRTGHPFTTVDVSMDEHAYWRLVRSLWATGDSFVLVEHDIGVKQDTLDDLESCGFGWCSYGYVIRGGAIMNSFGCVRFRSTFIHSYPDIFTHPRLVLPVHWRALDSNVEMVLMERFGHAKHVHHGLLDHYWDGGT